MSKRYDICQGRESNGKTYWNKIGTMWENDDGKRSISFDALPVASLNPQSGAVETRAVVFEAKPRDGGGGRRTQFAKDDDDNIPF